MNRPSYTPINRVLWQIDWAMILGTVKWYSRDKGFGMLETPSDGAVFIHINSFRSKPIEIFKMQVIAFNKRKDRSDQKVAAADSRLLEHRDFPLVMSLSGGPNQVNLADAQRPGQPPSKPRFHSLLLLAADQLFRSMDVGTIQDTLCDYVVKELDEQLLIPFCEFVERWTARQGNDPAKLSLSTEVFAYIGDNLTPSILFRV
ncbi:cold-shock protein [Parapedobacter tibetensis]|uniref:cold-shock protein n=1 Tax=Parapedobacter tibetensis TaxID=2972951 RepID=UPI00214D81EE|nr:cold shock domain-containing protein [Parapedobacter tibetensis]